MWFQEIAWTEPLAVAERFAGLPALSFLDSAMPHETLGRYSTVACDPFGTFRVKDGVASWDATELPGHPLEALRGVLARYPSESLPDLPPFQGGAIGFLSYEFGWLLDASPGQGHRSTGTSAHLAFYDTVFAFDHLQRRCWIVATGWPAPSQAARRRRAESRIASFASHLDRPSVPRPESHRIEGFAWRPDVSRQAYRAAVERVKAYIRAGDIYQANIAQRFSARLPAPVDPLQLYRQLRQANPAPFAAYLRCGPTTILSSSPERLLRTRKGRVETRPIKGTARRSTDAAADVAASEALLRSRKDRAENIMIVDLLRNDLSRVCETESVDVPVLCGLETYAGVHHLVSVVTGVLRDGEDALDLIAATFPGGSITGAPKLRAMDIIDEIEGRPRGIYCGAIGAVGFDGEVDLNIAIRTLVLEGDVVQFQAGGGITILSDPDVEYEETLTKAQRIFQAFAPQDLQSQGSESGEATASSDALV